MKKKLPLYAKVELFRDDGSKDLSLSRILVENPEEFTDDDAAHLLRELESKCCELRGASRAVAEYISREECLFIEAILRKAQMDDEGCEDE